MPSEGVRILSLTSCPSLIVRLSEFLPILSLSVATCVAVARMSDSRDNVLFLGSAGRVPPQQQPHQQPAHQSSAARSVRYHQPPAPTFPDQRLSHTMHHPLYHPAAAPAFLYSRNPHYAVSPDL